MELLNNERCIDIEPKCIIYICEFCNEGEMIVDKSNIRKLSENLIPHRCSKCNKEMLLPKIYPYIEWIKIQ